MWGYEDTNKILSFFLERNGSTCFISFVSVIGAIVRYRFSQFVPQKRCTMPQIRAKNSLSFDVNSSHEAKL